MKIQDEKELQQLSLFFDVEGWTASNWISRSPIFLSFKKGDRQLLNETLLGTYFGIEIKQTGQQLDMADQDVFLWLVNLAKKNHNDKVYFSKYRILKELGKTPGTSSREWLEKSFIRLLSATIFFKPTGKKRFVAVHLIDALDFDEDREQQYIRLGHEVLELYKEGNFSLIDFKQRLQLKKPLAKWLQCFCSSHHKETKGYYLETLQGASGKAQVKKGRFKDDLVLAATELQAVGFLASFKLIDKTKGVFFQYKINIAEK
jgi:hypothetical protein